MAKQKRHTRRSKKGKRFKAGRSRRSYIPSPTYFPHSPQEMRDIEKGLEHVRDEQLKEEKTLERLRRTHEEKLGAHKQQIESLRKQFGGKTGKRVQAGELKPFGYQKTRTGWY